MKSVLPMAAMARMTVADLTAMIAKLLSQPTDARLFMTLSHLFYVTGNEAFALEMQSRALQLTPLYRINNPEKPGLKLLVLMGAGDPAINTPIDYLLEDSDIALTLLYLQDPLPKVLPEHDALLIALGESDASRQLLEQIDKLNWQALNPARHLLKNSRDGVYRLLKDIPGLKIPPTERISRDDLGTRPLTGQAHTVRPIVSRSGIGLAKIHSHTELLEYLACHDDEEFFLSRYIDYQSPDGFYRKARIVLIDSIPYGCHLAISDHWIVHYGSARMMDSAEKRQEEASFLQGFDVGFALRHQHALQQIAKALQLDYVVIDCAELPDGRLLIFEADNRGWVHATDPADIFPYKRPAMNKVFTAFRALLQKAANSRNSS